MARIPQEEIERLKHEVPLQRLAEARGVELRRHGAEDLVGLCVFHTEQTPSMVISPGKNLFHCFGCGAAGSPIDWVMKLEGELPPGRGASTLRVSFGRGRLFDERTASEEVHGGETPPRPARCR